MPGSEQYDVVIVGPHPDDVEMTMAGTVIKLVRAGKKVLNVSVTRGERGTYGTVESRREEFRRANEVMGSSGLMLDLPDTSVTNDYESKLKIARLMRVHRPKVVFTPYHTNPFGHFDGTANVDHYTTGQVVRDGMKLARFKSLLPELPPHAVEYVYYFMVPKDRLPSIVVDVSDVMEDVRRAIESYATQMSIQRHSNRIQDILEATRRYHGIRIGAEYGEPFLSDEALSFGPLEFFGPRNAEG